MAVPIALASPGHAPLGSEWQAVVDQLNTVWVDYSGTFTLTASTSGPTKGNSTYAAAYLLVHPKWCEVRIKISIGSTFSAGSGTYRFSLPFTASTGSQATCLGKGLINDSGTALRTCTAMVGGATWVELLLDGSTGGSIGSSGSGTAWASGDWIEICFGFEPA